MRTVEDSLVFRCADFGIIAQILAIVASSENSLVSNSKFRDIQHDKQLLTYETVGMHMT